MIGNQLDGKRRVDAARWLPWVVLGLLILFHAAANVLWLQQDSRSLYGDTGNHARASMAIFEALREPGLDLPVRINQATTFWPPLGYLLTQPLYVLLGVSTDISAATTTLWFALAILFTFFIGRTLYDWRAGLLGAFIFSFYPAMYLQSRTYYVDMALAAMVLIALYCLLRTGGFRRRRASLVFGLALGLAALTKNAFIIMTVGPLLAVAGRSLSANGLAGWRQLFAWQPGSRLEPAAYDLAQRLANMALAGVIVLLLAAPWYVSHLGILAFNAGEVTRDVHLTAKPVTWYLLKFDEALLIWPYALLLIGLAVGLVRWRQRGNWFTLLWLVCGVTIITMVTRQNVRYLLPVLPAAALLSAAWIVDLRSRGLRAVLISVTALFQVALFFVMSWGAPAAWNQALGVPVQDAHNPFNDNVGDRPIAVDPLAFLYYQYPPKPHRWPVQAVVDAVIGDIESSGEASQAHRFVSLSKLLDFEYSTFAYETELARVQGRPGATNLIVGDVPERDSYLTDFLDFDYVLVKSDDRSTLANRQNHRVTRDLWNRGDPALRERFSLVQRWDLQDGSSAELWKRTSLPLAELSSQERASVLRYVLQQTPDSGYAARLLALTEAELSEAPAPGDASAPSVSMTEEAAARANAGAALWRSVLAVDPDDATAWRKLVDALLIVDPAAALDEVQQASVGGVRADNTSPDGSGAAPRRTGLAARVRAALWPQKDLLPATQLALLRLEGRVLEALGQPAQAEAAYLAAVQQAPGDAAARAAAGAFFLRQGQTEAAQQQFRALAARYGADPAAVQAGAPITATAVVTESLGNPVTATVALPDVAALLAEQATVAPDDAMTHVRLGAWALQRARSGDRPEPDQAAGYFQRAIEIDPAAGLAYAFWANSLGNTGQITQALQIIDQGLQALPGDPALQAMQARWAAPDPGAASASAGDDSAYQAALDAGRSALRERRWDEAQAAAQQAVGLAAQRYEAQSLLGDALRGQGDYAGALDAYRQAAGLAPYLSVLHGRAAEMLARLDRPDEAAATALTALAIDEGRWENWYALGLAYAARALAAGDTDKRAETAQQAEAFLMRARDLAPAGNELPPRALAELRAGVRRAAASAGTEAAPAAGLGVHAQDLSREALAAARAQADRALQAGRPAEALALYRRLAVVNGSDRAARMGVAEAWAALGRTDEALAEFGAISVDWPDFPAPAIRQGVLLEAQGYAEPALAAYRAAASMAPGSADSQFILAFALARAGQRDAAIAAFEAGLALDPSRSGERLTLEEIIAGQ